MSSGTPRAIGAVVLGVVVLAGIGWCADVEDGASGTIGTTPTSAVDPEGTTSPSSPGTPPPVDAQPAPPAQPEPPVVPDAGPSGDPLVAAAREALPQLEVKGRAPKTGYDRDLFGQSWTDDVSVEFGRNGCDTRNDILRRDLRDITFRPGTRDCVVLTGVLEGPYTGERIDFVRGQGTSSEVQIDHVVAMSDAWQKGAQQLTEEQRRDFANDPLNLLAVAGWANQQKGDGDTATWLPPRREFRCSYVSRQVLVKDRYGLWVTPAERDAMDRVLAGC
ncbi:HNH endonuclease family protein [Dietzia sp. B32]|uniref:HNH endonuclease family protein n=1 Tax=Dietzia sp. B32 TaxID=2915130 RepID=UPI002898661B|nr:HNH endonuclease family protein [Dietzia sp. B32]